MKQLLILSGKGGTGKTTVASGFIRLSNAQAYADCDVDAPNLHLVVHPAGQVKKTDYWGMKQAQINSALCTNCGMCEEYCRFDAVIKKEPFEIDLYACEGCGVCERICPSHAIDLVPSKHGDLMLYSESPVFSTAQLKMGKGTSGLLVSEVKKSLKASAGNADIAIIDGSPGIGCPVIASMSGVDMVLIVTEPSISGICDMERIVKTAQKFQVPLAICINKHDTNPEGAEEIKVYCEKNKIPMVGKIPFDQSAVEAINKGLSIVEIECQAGSALKKVYVNAMEVFRTYI